MKNNEAYERLREARWRKCLNPSEKAELQRLLQAAPGLEADWRLEEGLSRAVEALPNVAVPSNFTARVLQGIELAESAGARGARSLAWRDRVRSWLPRLALGSAVVVLGLFSYSQFQAQQRAFVVQNIPTVAEIVAMPGPEALRDFDAIRALERAPVADEELLRLLE